MSFLWLSDFDTEYRSSEGEVVPVNTMNAYGAVEMQFHSLLGWIGHLYASAGLPSGKRGPVTYRM